MLAILLFGSDKPSQRLKLGRVEGETAESS